MLFKRHILEKIAQGDVRLAFRRWERPSVRSGGTLKTSIGVLAIETVERVSEISEPDARAAGADSLAELLASLARTGDLYRVRFHRAGPDPRIALSKSRRNLEQTLLALDKLDAKEAWTGAYLRLIQEKPGVKASCLATNVGLDTAPFKARIRRLKELGLTESLVTGYRISPRGAAVLKRRRCF